MRSESAVGVFALGCAGTGGHSTTEMAEPGLPPTGEATNAYWQLSCPRCCSVLKVVPDPNTQWNESLAVRTFLREAAKVLPRFRIERLLGRPPQQPDECLRYEDHQCP